jgi:hypothetical protein
VLPELLTRLPEPFAPADRLVLPPLAALEPRGTARRPVA